MWEGSTEDEDEELDDNIDAESDETSPQFSD